MTFGEGIFGFVALSFILGYFLYIVYYTLDLFFLNPFQKIPALNAEEIQTITYNLPFYKRLTESQKKRFNKRTIRFRSRKTIVYHNQVEQQEKITLLLSATAVMLTFGMADFLILSVNKILVYPEKYYSKFTRQNHYGEYNPALKLLVFSENKLLQGFKIPNDNINLAVHEFAHAISFNNANKLNIRSYIFMLGIAKIKKLFNNVDFMERVGSSGYFRAYGSTNEHEFFAVAVESFVETPKDFKKKFPDLHGIIYRMLNYKF